MNIEELQKEIEQQRRDIGKLKAALIHAMRLLRGHHEWLNETGIPFDTVDFGQSYGWMEAYLLIPQPGDPGYKEEDVQEPPRPRMPRPRRPHPTPQEHI